MISALNEMDTVVIVHIYIQYRFEFVTGNRCTMYPIQNNLIFFFFIYYIIIHVCRFVVRMYVIVPSRAGVGKK